MQGGPAGGLVRLDRFGEVEVVDGRLFECDAGEYRLHSLGELVGGQSLFSGSG